MTPHLPYYIGTSRHTPILIKEVTYWRHHLFVESESDVCTIILVIGVRRALGLHWLETGGSTLAHTSAGVHEALVIEDRNAALPTGAFTVPFVKPTRPRATPDLWRRKQELVA